MVKDCNADCGIETAQAGREIPLCSYISIIKPDVFHLSCIRILKGAFMLLHGSVITMDASTACECEPPCFPFVARAYVVRTSVRLWKSPMQVENPDTPANLDCTIINY